ncbi:MAG TPA: hypothetical protein VIQ31_33190 [Phormidium sp.]
MAVRWLERLAIAKQVGHSSEVKEPSTVESFELSRQSNSKLKTQN